MSTLSLAARGKIAGLSRYAEAMPHLIQLFEMIDSWAKHIGTDNLDALVVTTGKINDGAVTVPKIADGVCRIASGQFTGDGLANREVALGFRPRYVWVLDHTNSTIYESVGDTVSTFLAGYRVAAGTWTGTDAVNWQGCSTNGFKCGTGAGDTSNTLGHTYSYYALR